MTYHNCQRDARRQRKREPHDGSRRWLAIHDAPNRDAGDDTDQQSGSSGHAQRAAPRDAAAVLKESRRVEVELVAHIGEVDRRRLYARTEASPSMYVYCTDRLHLSPGRRHETSYGGESFFLSWGFLSLGIGFRGSFSSLIAAR